jgi:flagellar motor switch protein FliG
MAPPASGLQGADRVAALLMSLDQPVAARLMKHLDADQIREVTRAVAELGEVLPDQVEGLIEDFAGEFLSGANLVGDIEEAEHMLDGVLPPEKIAELMMEVQGNGDRTIWERLSTVPENILANYIAKEHPQTAAFILSRLKTNSAALVLGQLEPEYRISLVRRMIASRPVTDDAQRILERALHEDFKTVLTPVQGPDVHSRIAEIMNKMEPEKVDLLLGELAASKPESAARLKSMMFRFEDMGRLDLKARSAVFGKASNDMVVLALRGADADVRELILQALSSRVRRMVEQELGDGQDIPQKNILEARRGLTELIMDMASRGEIEIGDDPAQLAA